MRRLLSALGLLVLCTSCAMFQGKGTARSRGKLDFEAIIQNAKSKVFPSLVFVKPIREEYSTGEKTQQEVFGSGVIISPDGYVVTNNHVVENAIQIYCVLFDKEQYPATIVGLDPETDLALLKLAPYPDERSLEASSDAPTTPPATIFPAASFGNSESLTEGQFVMALGSPFGFTRSISLGIISNVHRYIGFQTRYKYNTWIQTDAAINPGNSGGPLVNTDGEIIGINTLGLSGIGEGMAFSIPSNVVVKVVERLKKDGRVIRAWTGLHLQALKDFHSNTFTPAKRGVLVQNVESASPSERSGIRPGDIMIALAGHDLRGGTYVEELPSIRWQLADLAIDDPVEIRVLRNGGERSFTILPALKGKFEGEDFDCRRWNFTVKEISKYATPKLYFHRRKGVYIQGVRYPGNARSAGLQRNDIILTIDHEPIRTLGEVKDVYEKVTGDEEREKKVVIKVLRNNYPRLFVLDYRFDYNEED